MAERVWSSDGFGLNLSAGQRESKRFAVSAKLFADAYRKSLSTSYTLAQTPEPNRRTPPPSRSLGGLSRPPAPPSSPPAQDSSDTADQESTLPVGRATSTPRLYVHIVDENDRSAATRLSENLQNAPPPGVVVPGVQRVDVRLSATDIRYLKAADKASADAVAALVERNAGSPSKCVIRVRDLSGIYGDDPNVKLGTLELWLPPGSPCLPASSAEDPLEVRYYKQPTDREAVGRVLAEFQKSTNMELLVRPSQLKRHPCEYDCLS